MYSDGKEVQCEHQPCVEILPQFWGWVANAKYKGTIKIQEVTYDEWVGTVSGAGPSLSMQCYTAVCDFACSVAQA